MFTLVNPSFTIEKRGLRGPTLYSRKTTGGLNQFYSRAFSDLFFLNILTCLYEVQILTLS